MDTNKGAQVKLDFYFKSGSSLTQTPEAGRTKLDAQIASELHLGKKMFAAWLQAHEFAVPHKV
jgi:hypothetical protein